MSRSLIALLLASGAGPFVAVSSHASGGTNQEVDPRLECVEPNVPSVGLYTAHWGYENETSSIINIPLGAANEFTPAPIDRGQPVSFSPGERQNVFTTIFDGSNLTWTLIAPDGHERTATATSNPIQRCASCSDDHVSDHATSRHHDDDRDGDDDEREECDDHDHDSGDGCNDQCEIEDGWTCTGSPSHCTPTCGDRLITGSEQCDDGDITAGDGCNSHCQIESGWSCHGTPSVCAPSCGDGLITGNEQCDDGNVTAADGCGASCQSEPGWSCSGVPSVCTPTCGDSLLTGGEQCDDGSAANGDGCSDACLIEPGWTCGGLPRICLPSCGDGLRTGNEFCDDGNSVAGDGCGITCEIEPGWSCLGAPSVCTTPCGDGVIAAAELCDDRNTTNGDGCDASCQTESGWSCMGAPSLCSSICGDGVVSGTDSCDDGNLASGDGCSGACQVESGWSCSGSPSGCVTTCGDGILAGAEACDDGNLVRGDGCSNLCAVERGWSCSGIASLCSPACGDGIRAGAEQCDDGHTLAGDCCSAACTVEAEGSSCSSDTNACTDDVCNGGGTCTHVFNTAPCSDGSACTVSDVCAAGACTPGAPLVCNDGNLCTNDSCNPASGCVATPNTAACNDSSACTIGDSCSGGICVPGGPLSCEDANSCTDDSCQPASGCVHVNNPSLCAVPTESVQPIVECVVENGPGDFTAHFGYLNANTAPVSIPVGADNSLAPAPIDRGQTTTFSLGRSPFFPATAFQVDFDGNILTWTLRSPNGTTLATTASASSGRCPAPPTLLRQYSICYGTADFTGKSPKDLLLQSIEDTFEARTFDLRHSRNLCVPVQVTYAGQLYLVVDPETHLRARNLSLTRTKLSQSKLNARDPANQNIQVDDIFGTRRIDITRLDEELMPAAICRPATQSCPADPAALSLAGIGSEEFKCYQAKASVGSSSFPKRINLAGVDVFQSRVYRVSGPKLLCTRANRGGADPAAVSATEGRLCYGLRVPSLYCEPGSPAPYAMASCRKSSDCGGSRCVFLPRPLLNPWIFGVRTRADAASQIVTALYPKLLCVPAEITR